MVPIIMIVIIPTIIHILGFERPAVIVSKSSVHGIKVSNTKIQIISS